MASASSDSLHYFDPMVSSNVLGQHLTKTSNLRSLHAVIDRPSGPVFEEVAISTVNCSPVYAHTLIGSAVFLNPSRRSCDCTELRASDEDYNN